MSKAHNSFYVTHSNQITHLTNLRYHNFEDEKNTMTISSAMNAECYWSYPTIFFIIITYCFLAFSLMPFSCLFLRGDMWSKKLEVYRYWGNFAKIETSVMLKSIKLPLVNLSSVKIHCCKLATNTFTVNTGLNMS